MGVKGLHWVDCKALVGRKLVARDLFGNEFARFDYDANNAAETARIPDFKRQTEERYRSIILSALETQQEEAVADGAPLQVAYDLCDRLNAHSGSYSLVEAQIIANQIWRAAHPTPVQKEEEGQTVSDAGAETENFREPGEFGDGATMRREREK